MLKKITFLMFGAAFVVACDNNSANSGINSLGSDFVRAFNQDPNDEPLDASELTLAMTPTREPFNP
jgi:hypothetical protein